ncbi:MAG: Nif11-like leader peptide family natural product precursor [Anaerolineaceae bacterium]|nr:Nif11-like leader peptide family natural product precursor [Anaerolineaceae bacterium]
MAVTTMQAQDFIEKLEYDSKFQAQFAVASPNSLDGVVDFANSKGYMITHEDLAAALKHYPKSAIADQLRHYVR